MFDKSEAVSTQSWHQMTLTHNRTGIVMIIDGRLMGKYSAVSYPVKKVLFSSYFSSSPGNHHETRRLPNPAGRCEFSRSDWRRLYGGRMSG
jgi:hypothetical protein